MPWNAFWQMPTSLTGTGTGPLTLEVCSRDFLFVSITLVAVDHLPEGLANSCESFSAVGDDNFPNTPASKIIGVPFFTSFQVKTQYSSIAASNEQELSAQGSERALLSNFPPGPTPIDPSGLFVCRGPGLAPFQVAMDLLCLDAVHFFPQALGASEHGWPFVCRGPGLASFQVAMDLFCLDAVHFFPQALGASEHYVPHGPFYFTKRSQNAKVDEANHGVPRLCLELAAR